MARGRWIWLPGPKRLVAGTDVFMVSAPLALRQFAFVGYESSIEFAQVPFRLGTRDCIVITGPSAGYQVQLAIAQDNLPDIWQALADAGASVSGFAVPAANPAGPSGRPARSAHYSLKELASALTIVLLVDVAAWFGEIALPALAALTSLGFLAAAVIFLVWFYRARVNSSGYGWQHRLASRRDFAARSQLPSWAVIVWFIPVINLWLPFQIMVSIWRASLPDQARAKRAVLPGIWWASLLSFFAVSSFLPASLASHVWYLEVPVYAFGVLAAGLTALLVRQVSSTPPTHPPGP